MKLRMMLAAGVIAAACAGASAQTVALQGDWVTADDILRNNGFTVQENIDLNQPITVDALFIGRLSAPQGQALANVLDYLNNGGCVVTEFISTNAWFDGTLGSFAGTQENSFYNPNGVDGGNTVTIVDPNGFSTQGLNGSFISGDPIGALNVYSGLDPAINVESAILDDDQFAEIPISAQVDVGDGSAIMWFSDFADFNNPIRAEEITMLINSALHVPAPNAIAALGLGGLLAARRRR